jgi:hypothetical protein
MIVASIQDRTLRAVGGQRSANEGSRDSVVEQVVGDLDCTPALHGGELLDQRGQLDGEVRRKILERRLAT